MFLDVVQLLQDERPQDSEFKVTIADVLGDQENIAQRKDLFCLMLQRHFKDDVDALCEAESFMLQKTKAGDQEMVELFDRYMGESDGYVYRELRRDVGDLRKFHQRVERIKQNPILWATLNSSLITTVISLYLPTALPSIKAALHLQ